MVNDRQNPYETEFAGSILIALQSKLMYLGTVAEDTIAKRRAKNKVARKQRRINRQRA